MPAKARAQEDKLRAIEARGLPDTMLWAWPCRPLVRQGHARGVTQEDKLPTASRGWAAPRPTRQPLEPTSFATKKTPEGPPGGGRSKPT
jgi:hypothetical protein